MHHKKYCLIYEHWMKMAYFPEPQDYYQTQFPELKFSDREWVSVKCCFHKDQYPSLRVNLKLGNFRCFACGTRGGNIIAFHRQRYGLSLKEAIETLRGKSC